MTHKIHHTKKIIFRTKNKEYKSFDIMKSLRDAGLRRGDIIMVQSGLDTFGKLGDILNKEKYTNCFINAFRTVLGKEGTLLVPTFTYSFCRGEVYDPDNTPVSNTIEKLGILPEVFRKRKDAVRSLNPIFSVSAIGKKANELTSNLSKNCFGENSIYDKLLKIKNSKYVIFGVPYFSCTYVHYIERRNKVPYRFVKKFKGKIKIGKKEFEDEYDYYVRYLNKNINTDFSKLEKHLLKKKMLRVVALGNNYIKVVKISDIVNEGTKMLKKNPLSFLKNKPNLDEKGKEMYELMRRLFPICRSLSGYGTRKTLNIIQEYIPIKIHKIFSGAKVFDWRVPKEWNIFEAFIKDSAGKKIIDFKDNNLHILNYSIPIYKKITLKQLKKHIYTLKDDPNLIPYRTSYYDEEWGFCMSYNKLKELKGKIYEVFIDSKLKEGVINFGEIYIKGKSDEEIIFSTYVCHPSMANDNLSGIVLLTFLAKELLKRKNLKYSYRFLFSPETIGSIIWLAINNYRLPKIKAGLIARFLGDYSEKMTYKKSRVGCALIDKIVEKVFIDSKIPYEIIDFDPSSGGDERQFCSPRFNLPIGVLMRTQNFPEYHTSADDLSIISSENLADSLKKYLDVVFILENNEIYVNLNQKCEPQLGKRGLYRTIGSQPSHKVDEKAIMWILNLSDSTNSLLDIAIRSRINFKQIKKSADILVKKGLLKKQNAK